jgi:penicillin V acylase-like amidase (Ntn superfamily)
MWHMMLIVMQTCATVDEALDLLRTVRVWFPDEGNHWLTADATGKSVVVEWTPGDHKLVVLTGPALMNW